MAVATPGFRRRWLAPEVIQTSAMDCGPAALKCLLEGFGVPVSYGRLREACQTSVDGSSIDTLEDVARLLGLDAEQIMLPAEHVAAPDAAALPAIAVIRLQSSTHFVVLWRRVGPFLQVMDPARGRRWVRASNFLPDLYLHAQPVPAEAFHAFAADPGFTGPLGWRVRRALGRSRGRRLLDTLGVPGAAGASWRLLARIDGAVRAVEALRAAGAVRRGREAEGVVRALVNGSGADAAPGGGTDATLASYACAIPHPSSSGDGAGEQVLMRGAVLVRVAGLASQATGSSNAADAGADDGGGAAAVPAAPPLPVDLAAALGERRPSLVRTLLAFWSRRARWLAGLLVVAATVAATGTMAELAAVRPLLSSGDGVGAGVSSPSASAFWILGSVVLGLLVVEWPLALGTRHLGRALDVGLRRAFLRKLPRLGDRYFSSRPVSDMAERAHLLHRVRLLPALAGQLGRTVLELIFMTLAIVWLYPPGATIAFGLLAIACAVPLLGGPTLAERDLRLRVHSGSLVRFYLDALLGLSAVRTHGAERAVIRAHDDRLVEWRRAGRAVVVAVLSVESGVVMVTALGAGALVLGSLDTARTVPLGGATTLLLLFFALGLPVQAARLVALWRQLPDHRNVTLRLVEPLGAPDEQVLADAPVAAVAVAVAGPGADAPVAIELDDVSVEAGGHPVLTGVSCRIDPLTHVAIVGPSGAGKSTFLGLLLGFYRPSGGRILIDGQDLTDGTGTLAALRARTSWVEPAVQLWNASLEDNVTYGAAVRPAPADLARALEAAELTDLVSRLPRGAATPLGEGGGLLSGGEGQRVRLARELLRVPHPRLVLLDEPFRGLDRDTRARLLDRARRSWAGATLIAVSHDIEHTLAFPRVLVVEGGRIVEDGAPWALAESPGSRYAALLAGEARLRAQRWSAPFWRRLRVGGGHVLPDGGT